MGHGMGAGERARALGIFGSCHGFYTRVLRCSRCTTVLSPLLMTLFYMPCHAILCSLSLPDRNWLPKTPFGGLPTPADYKAACNVAVDNSSPAKGKKQSSKHS